MRYILNESLTCELNDEDGLILSATDSGSVCVKNEIDEILEILTLLSKPRTYDEIFHLFNLKFHFEKNEFDQIFDEMHQLNYVKKYEETFKTSLTSYHLEKYKRQISSLNSVMAIERSDALTMQEKICKSTVCLIGIGGTGSHLALELASIGVENLILVDYDVIELSNTSRQILYSEEDIGKRKTDVAKYKLKKYNSRINITTYDINIQNEEDFNFLNNHSVDLMVLCADTPRGKIQYITDAAAHKFNIPWFPYGPLHHSQIIIGPYIIPNTTKNFTSFFGVELVNADERVETINKRFTASICDPYNGFASQFAAIECFKILSGYRESALVDRMYHVNTDTWEIDVTDWGK